MRKPRIVITYLEAGMGHIVSARAISDALKKFYGDKLEIIDLEIAKVNKTLKKYQDSLVNEVKKSNKILAFLMVMILYVSKIFIYSYKGIVLWTWLNF